MKRKKNIFLSIFLTTLALLSIFSLFLFKHTAERQPIDNNNYTFKQNIQMMSLALAKQVDPNYEPLVFDESVIKEDQEKITSEFYETMSYIKNDIESDQSFEFEVINTKTKETYSNTENIQNDLDAAMLHSTIQFDDSQNATITGNIAQNIFTSINPQDILTYYYDYYDSWDASGTQSISIQMPTNIKITYKVSEITLPLGIITSTMFDNTNRIAIITIYMAGCTLLIGLFLLFYPISITQDIVFFKVISKWKALAQWTILPTLNAIMISFTAYLFMYLDYISLIVASSIKFDQAQSLVHLLMILCLFATLFIIALSIQQLKYIFANGIIRYLKEDTLCSSLIRWIKRQGDSIIKQDLSILKNKDILKMILIHAGCIFIICTFWALGYILLIIYCIALFIYLNKKRIEVQSDYKKLLTFTDQLSQGNFDIDIQDDLGLFNQFKEESLKLKTGFKKAVEEETKSQNMKTELISNVSHDLKTPLTCIKNYVVLLKQDDLSKDDQEEYLKGLETYANRLNTLIEDLFDISKVNSGNIQLECMDINIIALIEQGLAESEEILQEKNLDIIKNFPEEEIITSLDGDKTYRIIENLLVNIGKYALPNSRIYIDITQDDKNVSITLKNISEQPMNFTPEQIVERFVRGDKSRHETGSGLGLAIAKSFTEAQGGHFEIQIDGDLFKTILTFKKTRSC